MSILLINPWIYDFKAYDLWLKPLGLLYIADFLIKSGYEINFIDCLYAPTPTPPPLAGGGKGWVDQFGTGKYQYEEIEKPPLYKNIPRKYKRYGISIYEFKEKLKNIPAPEFILVTCTMTYWYLGAFEAIKTAKEFFPDTPVMLGGIYARLCHEHAKKYSGADLVIGSRGRGGVTPPLQGSMGEGIEEIVGAIHESPLHANCRPAYYLYPHLDYACVITSTGCPFKCAYCASKYLYDKFYQRNPDDVVDEIAGYASRGIKNIAFYDDALFFNKEKHINIILDKIIAKDLQLNFHTPNGVHARFIDKELARRLKESGFKTIRLGLETQDPLLQKKTGGKTTNKGFVAAVENLFDAGFSADEIGAYTMVGMPEQGYDEIVKTIEFVKKLGIKIKLTQFSPIPHTQMGDKMLAEHKNPDPLLHNNTYWQYNSKMLTFEQIQKITEIINPAKKTKLYNGAKN